MSATILIPPGSEWNTPERVALANRRESEIPERERLVRRAINDPGHWTGRGYAPEASQKYEDLSQWQARAVCILLDRLAHEQGPPNTAGADRCTECGEQWGPAPRRGSSPDSLLKDP